MPPGGPPLRRDPLVTQLLSALRKPWVEGESLQIIDGIPTWGPAAGGGGDGHGATRFRTSNQTQAGGAATNEFLIDWNAVYNNNGTVDLSSASIAVVTEPGWYSIAGWAQLNVPDPGVPISGYLVLDIRGDVNQRLQYTTHAPFTYLTGTDLYTRIAVCSEPIDFTGDVTLSDVRLSAGASVTPPTTVGTLTVVGMAARSDGSPGLGSARLGLRRVA